MLRIIAASFVEGFFIVLATGFIFIPAAYLIERDSFEIAPFVILVLYPVPIFIAAVRKHNALLDIILTNLWLGWTIIGWVLSLMWACDWDVEGGPY
ncbi:MAG TPA: superinfection immunity protein [Candidatus Bathyarchaeia archaeon]|nr:superinfection immunity protein [Candidatus Bathyarchaeia archaeon]